MFGFGKSKLEIKRLELKILEKRINFFQNLNLSGFTNIINFDGDQEKLVREGYQENATVFSIIDLLVKSACNVPARVYRIRDAGALKEYKAGNLKAHQSALEPVDDSPLYKLLMNPNPMMGYSEWLQEVLGFKYLTGNSFIRIPKRAGTDAAYRIDVWPAQYTTILVNDLEIKGYRVQHNNFQMDAPVDEIMHIKNFNPDYTGLGDHLYGQSPLKAAYKNLTINNNAVSTGDNILKQQGARGILYPDDTNTIYGKEQAEQMERTYLEKHTLQGRNGKNSGVLWPSIKMGWINMALPAGDLALMEQYNTSVKDICGLYKVPSILLNDTAESKVESYREAKKYMYQQGIFPELISLRDELNRLLTPRFGKDLYIDFDFMSVPEIQEDMEKVTKQLNIAWWITPNEKRKIMKFPPLDDPEMDQVYIPANLLNMSDGITGELTGGDPST